MHSPRYAADAQSLGFRLRAKSIVEGGDRWPSPRRLAVRRRVWRQVVVGARSGGLVEVHAAPTLSRGPELGQKRGAHSWAAVHRGPAERCSSRSGEAQHMACSSVRRLGPLVGIVAPLPARSRVGKRRRCESSEPAGPRRASSQMRLRVELSSSASLCRQAFRRLCFSLGRQGEAKPNERMQLTWLIGAPSHGGFGSLARLWATRSRFIRHAADASR